MSLLTSVLDRKYPFFLVLAKLKKRIGFLPFIFSVTVILLEKGFSKILVAEREEEGVWVITGRGIIG